MTLKATDIGQPRKWRRYEPVEEPTRQEPQREVEPQEKPTPAPVGPIPSSPPERVPV